MGKYKDGYMTLPNGKTMVRFMKNRRIYKRTFNSKNEAKAWRRSIEDEHLLVMMGVKSEITLPKITMHELLRKYLNALKDENRPDDTIRDVEIAIRNLKVYFEADFEVSKLTSPMVRDYWNWRLKSKRGYKQTKGARILKDLTYLKAACNRYEIPINWRIDKGQRKRIEKKDRKILKPDIIRELLNAMEVGTVERAYCELMARLGIRPSEADRLKWDDIDLKSKSVTIVQRKTARTQYRTLSDKLVSALLDWKNSPQYIPDVDQHVFTKKGNPLSHGSLRPEMRRASKKVGIVPPLNGPHTIRHSFLSALSDNSISTDALSKVIGHTSVTTTEKYLAHNPFPQDHGAAALADELY